MSYTNGNGHIWSKFFWRDWANDEQLKICSMAAQGFWMRLLCIAHGSDPVGFVLVGGEQPTNKQLAVLTGATEKEVARCLAELEKAKVFSKRDDGVIYCRRMVRDAAVFAASSEYGKQGGNPQIIRGTVPKEERQRRYRRSDAPQKAQRIFDRDGGCCHWCGTPLQQEHPGPDFFHVDHILAIRDGGGNDEDNLVAACAACNHKRAHHDPTPTPPNGSDRIRPQPHSHSDPNPQSTEVRSEKLEPESEESKIINSTSFTSKPLAARGETPSEAPVATSAEPTPTTSEPPLTPDAVGPEVVAAALRRLGRALAMPRPYGEVRDRSTQLEALERPQPVVALVPKGDAKATPEPPPIAPLAGEVRWRPMEPVRTVEEQLAILRGDAPMPAEAA